MVWRKEQVAEEAEAFVGSSEEGNTGSTQDSDEEDPRPCTKCGRMLAPDVEFCPKCGTRREDLDRRCCRCSCLRCCCCCWCYLFLSTALLVAAGVGLAYSMNFWAKVGVEQVGNAVFGTDVTLGAINLGLSHGRATVTNMTVSSPPGYKGSFLNLGRFVFDLSARSVLAAWLSDWIAPIELQQLSVKDIRVFIDMNWTGSEDASAPGHEAVSNAQSIVYNMNKAVEDVPTPSPEEALDIGLHAIEAKVKVGKVEFSNINASILIRPFMSVPITWDLKEVLVRDIGENGNGVYLWEFVEILSRAILMAVIRGAPENIRANLAKVLGPGLFKDMDFSEIMYDTGEGLCTLSQFTGWAAGEATLLPLKFTAMQARITGKAIAMQTAMNLKSMEVGTKLTGMGIRANVAATNAVVKAGVKANEEVMKLRNAFTTGWMGALR